MLLLQSGVKILLMLLRPLSFYNKVIVERPLATKVATTFAIFGAGDIVMQRMENVKKWDYERTLRQSCVSGFIMSPLLHAFITRIITKRIYIAPTNRFFP